MAHTGDPPDRLRALHGTPEFLQAVLDSLSASIAILDDSAIIIAVNESWRQYGDENGMEWPDYGLGRNYLAAIGPSQGEKDEGADDAASLIRSVMSGREESGSLEYPCHSPTDQHWYTMWVTRFDVEGQRHVVVAHEDTTERRLREIALHEANVAVERAREEAEAARKQETLRRRESERRRRISDGLRDVLAVLNSHRPLQEVLDYIATQATELLSCEAVAICSTEEAAARREPPALPLSVRASAGLSGGLLPEGIAAVAAEALSKATATRQPEAVPDLSVWESQRGKRAPDPTGGPFCALLAVSIAIHDEAYGGMFLFYTEPRTFSDEEAQLAVLFASQVALAIDNARLQERVERTAVAAERSRLVRDLHDSVTQTLFSVSLTAQTIPRIWETHPVEARDALDDLQRMTQNALAEMRMLLLELRPAALTDKPLAELLRTLVDSRRTGLPIRLLTVGHVILPPDVQVCCYRVAEEALNNAIRHSRATEVRVSLSHQEEGIALCISDDGIGFDSEAVPDGHLGLGIMQERADSVGASLQVTSGPGMGTTVELCWPAEGADDGC